MKNERETCNAGLIMAFKPQITAPLSASPTGDSGVKTAHREVPSSVEMATPLVCYAQLLARSCPGRMWHGSVQHKNPKGSLAGVCQQTTFLKGFLPETQVPKKGILCSH